MDPITQQAVLATAGAAGGDKVYVDDVFSTFLVDGAGGQTITNGMDLATEGGMIWSKVRTATINYAIHDTERGINKFLSSNSTGAQIDVSGAVTGPHTISSFNTDGFTTGSDNAYGYTDLSGYTDYVHWTFRKAPGFFDVVTYTGNGTAGKTVAHSLGSVPGMIIVKCTSTGSTNWRVYHRSLGATKAVFLDLTNAANTSIGHWNDTAPTSTVFTVGVSNDVNSNGATYVAYVFAHDDQSFGTGGNESIIKCGDYYGNNSANGPIIDLGFEPQWVMIKNTTTSNLHTDWLIFDNMRGVPTNNNSIPLQANTTEGEGTTNNANDTNIVNFLPTGFQLKAAGYWHTNTTANQYIYMAIRRPNKPPTAATDVFNPFTVTDGGTNYWSPGFVPDMLLHTKPDANFTDRYISSRLTGNGEYLATNTSAAAAGAGNNYFYWNAPTGTIKQTLFQGTAAYLRYTFKRAPGFFDVVTYTGTGLARNQEHNLGVAPELVIVKARSGQYNMNWHVGPFTPGYSDGYLYLDTDMGPGGNQSNYLPSVSSSTFGVTNDNGVNGSGYTYVAYLFATLPGISKIGSYSGTGNDIDINCGFTAGARFVMIKRTDAAGSWYVFDSVRGIVSGNDPYLKLNVNSAQGTGDDEIDPLNTGFTVASTASNDINASGGTYLFLAIA